MKFFYLFFLFILFLSSGFSQSHEIRENNLNFGAKTYFKSFFHDGIDVLSMGSYMRPKDWAILSGVAIAGGLSYVYDSKVNTFFLENQHQTIGYSTKYFFDPLGGKEIFGGMALFTGVAYLSKNLKAQETGLNAIKAGVICGTGIMVVKMCVQRPRPYMATQPPSPKIFYSRDFQSFPSGHAANAFVMATVFSEAYKDDYAFVPYICYSLASLTAISRMYDNQHYLSDILTGATIGFIVGKVVSKKRNWHILNNNEKETALLMPRIL